jgi:predicted site-specific integrase-resolvase
MKHLDLTKWVTQHELAKREGVSIQAVQNWIRRGQIDTITLPGNTTLVNKDTLTIDTKKGRPRLKKV